MTDTKVTVAIPTYNRDGVLIDTIEGVLAQSHLPDEILVIDQSPRHDELTAARLAALHSSGQLRWITLEAPNLPAARNRALSESRSAVVVFIDDDVILPKDFVENHVAEYNDATVTAVLGRVIEPGPHKRRRTKRCWNPKYDYLYLAADSGQRRDCVATLRGCNHSVRRASVLALGGYDVNYVGTALREETDLALRIVSSGGRIVYSPSCVLTHLAIPSGGCRVIGMGVFSGEFRRMYPAQYFLTKHFFPSWHYAKETLLNVRYFVLRKENRSRPTRILLAAAAFACAIVKPISDACFRRVVTL